MRERVLGPSTDPAALPQERPQPARADMHPRLLLQVDRQARRCPHVEDQAERAGTTLERGVHRLQVGPIRLDRSTWSGRIRQGVHPSRGKAR